jgi:hypothetical protein
MYNAIRDSCVQLCTRHGKKHDLVFKTLSTRKKLRKILRKDKAALIPHNMIKFAENIRR